MTRYSINDFMVTPPITNADISRYATEHVNLSSHRAKEHRYQARILREKLEKYINDNPDYNLVKMLHSGSVAKGTALKNVNDIDVAVYVKAADAPDSGNGLTTWLEERLKEVYPDFDDDQFDPQEHCVTLIYRSGLKVDVVPVLYEEDENDFGYLITKSGEKVLTSISLHLEFIRKRKDLFPNHYAQFIRLVKHWIKRQKVQDDDYKFKSMMAELICAHLVDDGLDPSNYIESLQTFFAYIVKTELKQVIVFEDYYDANDISIKNTPIQIFDPVNPDNNVAHKYQNSQRETITQSAKIALNAITTANNSTTKAEAVNLWQQVFGPTFRG